MAEVSFLHLPDTVDDFEFEQEEIFAFDSVFPYRSHVFCTDSDPISLNDHHIHQANDFYPEETYDQFGELSGGASGSCSFEEILDRENQVTFVMDLLQQRVEQSHTLEIGSFELDPILESGFGIVERNTEEIGGNSVELELGEVLGLGTEFDGNRDLGYGDEEDDNFGGFILSDYGDEFYVSRRESGNNSGGGANGGQSGDGINRFSGGLNVVGFESDSEEDVDELLETRLLLEDDFASLSRYNDENLDLCWDSLQLDDHRDGNEEFEWEEVNGGLIALNPEESISVLPIIGPEEDEIRQVGSRTTQWEVLLNDNLERNAMMMDNNDDYIDTAEDEMTFGQFTEAEDASMGRPPASRLAVESLPLVVLTEADVQNGNALCAVCKDEMGVGEQAKQLPCSHRYHGDCIMPWLIIRNSCPVCRHELPTDDPDYELRRNQRAARD